MDFLERVEEQIRRHELIPAGAEVTCLVSGGADSCALWHSLRELGYAVSALHVNHGLRGDKSDEDARFCADVLGAEVVEAPPASTEAELRDLRYSFATDSLRATGHTASDQVETVVYRLVSSGKPGGIKPKREDGGVLRGCRAPIPHRLHQPGNEARADPRSDPASAPPARRASGEESSRARRGPSEPARRADGECGRLCTRRPRRRRAGRARVRPCLARTRTGGPERRDPVGPLENQLVGFGPQGPWLACGRPARKPLEEAAGCLRGRQGPALATGGLAPRGARRRSRRGAGDRRGRGGAS